MGEVSIGTHKQGDSKLLSPFFLFSIQLRMSLTKNALNPRQARLKCHCFYVSNNNTGYNLG